MYASEVGALESRAAFTLPGIGIFVNPVDVDNEDLLRHEFGHILQAQVWGNDFFYETIVPASVESANRANNDWTFNHDDTWTEWTANWFSYNYFNSPKNWNKKLHPIQPQLNSKAEKYPPVNVFDFYNIKIPRR